MHDCCSAHPCQPRARVCTFPCVCTALTQDLRECCAALAADPASAPEGSAPFYGMAASMPDRRLVGDFLEAYQDALLTV